MDFTKILIENVKNVKEKVARLVMQVLQQNALLVLTIHLYYSKKNVLR